MTPHSIPTNKSLGQHWLSDEAVLNGIADFAGVKAGETVLEIGPGPGDLTQVLINAGVKVVAVEFDSALAEALPQRVKSPHLTVFHEDILRFDLSQVTSSVAARASQSDAVRTKSDHQSAGVNKDTSSSGDAALRSEMDAPRSSYKVVANVPYYITSKIVRLLLESPTPPQSATLLVQKEVAERIAAAPGEMSLMSVAAQFYARVTLGAVVPAALFSPPPKVDSQLVRLDCTGARFGDIEPKKFFQIVRAGFGERRKKLRSSLSGGLHMSKPDIDNALRSTGIDADARAQELTLDDWHTLAVILANAD